MTVPLFDIVFRGVRAGFDPSLVKAQFATLFKLAPVKVDRIFKSRNVTLKNNADERLATIFIARLFAIGVVADKLVVEPVPSKAIYISDAGETSTDACSMHQPIDFVYGEHNQRIPFSFTGSGFEYFRIWLINVMACVLSAGILYPWAQVRALRYFYQHTRFADTEFFYTSNPQKIFLVQFLLLAYLGGLCYTFLTAPFYAAVGLLCLIIGMPLYAHKRASFQLQHSFYGHIQFRYTSNLSEVYKVFLLWPLLVLLSAGLLAPFAAYKIQEHRSKTLVIGDHEFLFSARIKNYLSLLPSLLFAEIITLFSIYYGAHLPLGFLLLLNVAVWVFVFIGWRVTLTNLQWNSLQTKLGRFVATWEVENYKKLVVHNLLMCILTAGLYWPWAQVRVANYKATHLAFFANQRFKKWRRRVEILER